MIRALYRTEDGRLHTDLKPDEFATALRDAQGLLWVDVSCESEETCEPILREAFGFHPLAIDDALAEAHSPKVDDWGSYLYLALHAVVFEQQQDGEVLETRELDVFLGPNYLVTYQARPITTVDHVWTVCERDERHLQRGAARLLYKLTDELVADYMPVIAQMDAAVDQIEDQIFNAPTPSILERLFALKRALLRLRLPMPTVGLTVDPTVSRQLCLSWGVTPAVVEVFRPTSPSRYLSWATPPREKPANTFSRSNTSYW